MPVRYVECKHVCSQSAMLRFYFIERKEELIKVFLELTRCRRIYGWFGHLQEYFYIDAR